MFVIMSRYLRKNKKTRRKSKQKINRLETNLFNEVFLAGEPEIIDTVFGQLLLHEMADIQSIKDKRLIPPILMQGEQSKDFSPLQELDFWQKLNQQFPNEAFIHASIADCYGQMEEEKMYADKIKDNYTIYKGTPAVDLTYARHLYYQNAPHLLENLFSKSDNLHEIYPNRNYFTKYELEEFSKLKVEYYLSQQQIDNAEKHAIILKQLNSRYALGAAHLIKITRQPWRRWVVRGIFLLLLGLLIWGIISFFRWLF